ncbi:hypothetical protein, partial [Klebsiella pneumoniae]|uniref:hypothetical protein n=1 Tax=Klebsiella pneumoniae TaxID=573 RepID=UPI001952BDDF
AARRRARLGLDLDQDLDFFRHTRGGGDPGPGAEPLWQVPSSPDGVRAVAPISRITLDPRLRGDDKVC